MFYKRIYTVPENNQLVISLPKEYASLKKVLVTINEISDDVVAKIELMKSATTDQLFLNDLNEIHREFDAVETSVKND